MSRAAARLHHILNDRARTFKRVTKGHPDWSRDHSTTRHPGRRKAPEPAKCPRCKHADLAHHVPERGDKRAQGCLVIGCQCKGAGK